MLLSDNAKRILACGALLLGLINLWGLAQTLARPDIFNKDFIQEYLLARAAMDGTDPYLPLQDLSRRFTGGEGAAELVHPSPHPPPDALLCLPLALLSYDRAAAVWLLLELLFVLAALSLLLRWAGLRPTLGRTVLLAAPVLGWHPLFREIALGQLMTLLLLLLVAAWLALRSGRDVLGGSLLGLVMAIKLVAWPVVIFLALRRNWRAAGAAAAVFVVANLGASVLLGFDALRTYYLKIGPEVSSLYRSDLNNFSTWSVGWRLFAEHQTNSPINLEAAPLAHVPAVAPYVSAAATLVVLAAALVLARRARSFDVAFAILVCVSVVVNPVAWNLYLVLLLIPVAVLARRLFGRGITRAGVRAAVLLGMALAVIPVVPREAILLYARHAAGGPAVFPAAIGLLTLTPLALVLGLMWIVWRLDRPGDRHSEGSCPPAVT